VLLLWDLRGCHLRSILLRGEVGWRLGDVIERDACCGEDELGLGGEGVALDDLDPLYLMFVMGELLRIGGFDDWID
jgi:hypothetical protein